MRRFASIAALAVLVSFSRPTVSAQAVDVPSSGTRSTGAPSTDATPLELSLIEVWVDAQIAVARHVGHPDHPDVARLAAQVAQRRAALSAALRSGATVDLPAVRAEVSARLSEIEARLAEVGRTCGPIPDTTPARARRDALMQLLEALDRGPFTG